MKTWTSHGASGTPEYKSWHMMKQRCSNPNDPSWHNYGGRGITFDPRWSDFRVFIRDMGKKPTKKHTLERENNAKGYTKDNCVWAPRVVQLRNTRRTKLTYLVAEEIRRRRDGGCTYRALAQQYGISHGHVWGIVTHKVWATDV